MKRGFSVIEVMMAAAIFGIGLAGIFTAFNTAGMQFEHQRHTTQGIHLAEAKMEELLLAASTDGALLPGLIHGPAWYDPRGFASGSCDASTTGVPASTATCRYRVTWEARPSPVPGVRILTVTTDWAERGQRRSVSFNTQRN